MVIMRYRRYDWACLHREVSLFWLVLWILGLCISFSWAVIFTRLFGNAFIRTQIMVLAGLRTKRVQFLQLEKWFSNHYEQLHGSWVLTMICIWMRFDSLPAVKRERIKLVIVTSLMLFNRIAILPTIESCRLWRNLSCYLERVRLMRHLFIYKHYKWILVLDASLFPHIHS